MHASSPALVRLLPRLRLPGDAGSWHWDGDALRNAETGQAFPIAGGVLDLLGDRFRPTLLQRALDTWLTAALYDRWRDWGLRLAAGIRSFAEEADRIDRRLELRPGQVVLDLACGQGNFTVAWSERVGDEGLVVGLDIARAMLARAARRVERGHRANVALLRADALDLPFRDASFEAVNCSGGFHQLPDLPRAIREIARVLTPGGRLTASTFARNASSSTNRETRPGRLHRIDLARLADTIQAADLADYGYEMAGASWGYLWARRPA